MSSEYGIGDKLREARIAAGMSQRDLALASGLHQPQIAQVEQGRDLRVSSLIALARALGLEVKLEPLPAHTTASGKPPPAGGPEEQHTADFVETTVAGYAREWPTFDPQVFAVMARIMRASQYLGHTLEQLGRAKGLSVGEVLLLGALRRMGPPYESTPSELKRLFWISLPGITKRLNRLERLGLVERSENPADRRQNMVRLTRKGHATPDDYPLATEFTILNLMDAGARQTLSDLLRSVLAEFERHPAGEVNFARKWSKAASRDNPGEGLTAATKRRNIAKPG